MHSLSQLKEYLPFLIPLFLIQLGLMIAALVHIFRHKNYRIGNRVLWVILAVALNTIGPVLYFTIGRGED
ncbi:PLD nuclease N-terminal domain-containing protein [Anaerocolumna xylanovorans]|uniref:Phospholipase_D-nuclease N-terminal n=1 Tax=Anaerocolumna xylanovorans DSM 12503 TaxID=1121345 RepID=A0A1M7YHE5_9FIRM|nr:PLD nuclease N-terminal domain-containing protein [Anaerocolumna xylanovorans]SHO51996.1 Phospholipase_D-nuclease N-terminal [Anaerocolumna xylanovorans DSM 12503]